MADPHAQLIEALRAILFDGAPAPRAVMLRPRPWYLPHPCRRLPRLPGVVRGRLRPAGAPWPRPAVAPR